jgi:hypothetical protein
MGEHRQAGWPEKLQPGHIWLVEHPSQQAFFACDRDALASADAVIFDRALASAVASVLPIGAYAELLPRQTPAGDFGVSERALGLAADGWRVVQLVPTAAEPRARLRSASGALIPPERASNLPVVLIAKTPEGCRGWDTSLQTLSSLADEVADEDCLTLIFGPLGVDHAAHGYAASANGLAG